MEYKLVYNETAEVIVPLIREAIKMFDEAVSKLKGGAIETPNV